MNAGSYEVDAVIRKAANWPIATYTYNILVKLFKNFKNFRGYLGSDSLLRRTGSFMRTLRNASESERTSIHSALMFRTLYLS